MSTWHVAENGKTTGPFTSTQIADGLATGQYTPTTMVWKQVSQNGFPSVRFLN